MHLIEFKDLHTKTATILKPIEPLFNKHTSLNLTSPITMPWGLWSDTPSQPSSGADDVPGSSTSSVIPPSAYSSPPTPPSSSPPIPAPPPPPPPKKARPVSWNDSLNATDWAHYAEPRNWIPTAIAVVAALGLHQFYRSYLRRLPGTGHVSPGYFRKRSLLGKVTSVGDGDNFHLFHTPGGRLAGWGWLRKVPVGRKEVRGRTVSYSLTTREGHMGEGANGRENRFRYDSQASTPPKAHTLAAPRSRSPARRWAFYSPTSWAGG